MVRTAMPFLLLLSTAAIGYSSVDPGLAALLPASTRAVFGVDAAQARGTDLGQFLLNDTRWTDSNLQDLINQTGFDPRRDLLAFIVASNTPAGPHSKGAGQVAVLARGNFDAARIGAAAQQHGSTVQNLDGVAIYVSPNGKGTAHGFAILETDVAVMGDLGSVQQVVSNRATPTQIDPDLARLMNKAGNDGEVWFASIGLSNQFAAAMNPGGAKSPQAAQVLQGIVESSGGMKLGKDVQVSFDAIARSEKDATSLGDVIRFLASAAQVKRDQDPQAKLLGPALDNLNLTTTGNEVHLTTSVPESLLEQVAPQGKPRAAHAH